MEDVYDAQYNYGGPNAVDYQIPELEYGQFSTTQTGVMEKALLPGLQAYVATSTITSGPGGYGISGSGSSPTVLPGVDTGAVTLPPMPQFTELTDEFLLSNGAIGRISIPAIGVRNFYLWQGETASSMNKGLGHFTSTSVWDGNVGACGHNRGARYNIGEIKDLDVGIPSPTPPLMGPAPTRSRPSVRLPATTGATWSRHPTTVSRSSPAWLATTACAGASRPWSDESRAASC